MDQTPKADDGTYDQIMNENRLEHEKDRVEREMIDKYKSGELVAKETAPPGKRVRFDQKEEVDATPAQGRHQRLNLGGGSISAAAEVILIRILIY